MRIATILPTSYLFLEKKSDYHLCLAHQVKKDPIYAEFFKMQVTRGAFVIQDNGVVETGTPLNIDELVSLADQIKCQEMILPDFIYDLTKTLRMSLSALRYVRDKLSREMRLMAVPQGDTQGKWVACVREMLSWNIDTFGITRFLVPKVFSSRLLALESVPELLKSNKEIHLLGCPENPREIAEIDKAFLGRIRGVDSGIAAIYTQAGQVLAGDKPDRVIDLDAKLLDEGLLKSNIRIWKGGCK